MATAKGLPDEVDVVEQWNREDAAELERPVGLGRHAITVASRDWTVETIVRQVEQGNIDLDPAFQRRNAWRDARRSRLVESFVLGFPVPQLVLAENPRRKASFILIDGKQRLLTVAGLFLQEYRSYWAQPRFSGLTDLEDLNGVSLDEFLERTKYGEYRRRLGNADIRTTVITGFKDEGTLYDIFYRINTGSVPLSSQELRQVLNRGSFSKYLLETTGSKNPLWEVLGIDAPDPRLSDVELLLRLIAWRRFSAKYRGDMKGFLDDSMRTLNNDWSKERTNVEDLTEQLFLGIGSAIRIFGRDVGRKFKAGKFERALNRALFEVQAYYLSFPKVRAAAIKKRLGLLQSSKQLFDDNEFIASVESTTKSLENSRIRFGRYHQMMESVLGVEVPPLKIAAAK